ncbi:uncharacterized protein A4U43_C06F18800 [Asparagus officinalis]|uniref:Sugar phosphate transporter domain-containing protein n=1 Tax=Asparagus officinalis TaxID=4686 RepID=A0A5P1EMS8_ASPOF|nr:uncharacterized protein A4U43_C06F18800 [Asparagus officinalis]
MPMNSDGLYGCSGIELPANGLLLCIMFDNSEGHEEKIFLFRFGLLIRCISGALASSVWLRNSANLYTSGAFMHVLKIAFHVAVAVLENVFENGATQYKMLLSTIILGVIVASYGEVSSSWPGVGYQMGSVICEALRLVVTQYLGVHGGAWLNSISAMFGIDFFSSTFFPVPWMFWEKPMIDPFRPWGLSVPCILIVNCLLMFALNLYTCLVISRISAQRFARAKSFRDLVVVFLFPFLLGETGFTLTSTSGYLIALVGLLVCYPLKEKALVEDERMTARSKRRKVGSRSNLGERVKVLQNV